MMNKHAARRGYLRALSRKRGRRELFGSLEARVMLTISPFGGTALNITTTGPAKLEAENFDNGGADTSGNSTLANGAYFDNDATNNGGQYGRAEGVDIEHLIPSDATSGYDVGWTNGGEWLGYTVNVQTAGDYDITARVSSGNTVGTNGGFFHLELGSVGQKGGTGTTSSGLFVVPGTGNWTSYTDVTIKGVSLNAGTQWVRLVEDTGDFNVDYVTFSKSTAHQDDAAMLAEHRAVMKLVPTGKATNVAITNGNWSSAGTWARGEVPTSNADVWIPSNYTVTYDLNGTGVPRLHTVRVDGTLQFPTSTDTKMIVDTIVVAAGGTLNMGTAGNPITAKATIDFAGTGAIDTQWDPYVFSRGLIGHGNTNIYGTEKTSFVSISTAPHMGDSVLHLDSAPSGWQAGDKLVLTGTTKTTGNFHDEVLTLTSIDAVNKTVTFTNAGSGGTTLLYDHVFPTGYGLKVYLENLTRNVVFETENWQLGTVPDSQRGHVMFMHSALVHIDAAGFYGLGRTGKKGTKVTDPDGSGSGTTYANPRGRYSVHFHHLDNLTLNSTAQATLTDSAIDDSPGWGVDNHGSNVKVEDNASFNVVGAGFVTEDGDELGTFKRNISVKNTGDGNDEDDLNFYRSDVFDMGHNGHGFWIQGGGGVTVENNVAASNNAAGFYFWGNEDDQNNTRKVFPTANLSDPSLRDAYGRDLYVGEVPLLSVKDNTAFNSDDGLVLAYHLRNAPADFFTAGTSVYSPSPDVIDGLTSWNNRSVSVADTADGGRHANVLIFYSTHVVLKNSLLLGNSTGVSDPTTTTQDKTAGVRGNWEAGDVTLENDVVKGFDQGVALFTSQKQIYQTNVKTTIIGGTYENRVNLTPGSTNTVGEPNFAANPPAPLHTEIIGNVSFATSSTNNAPTAAFSSTLAGGYSVALDGSGSSDTDPATTLPNRIMAYGWDFDNNGTIDGFGRTITHDFGSAGSRTVGLTVWDNMGATAHITQSVNVSGTAYGNKVLDGGFSGTSSFFVTTNTLTANQMDRGSEWISGPGSNWVKDTTNHYAVAQGLGGSELIQMIRNDKVYQGTQTVAFDVKYAEGSGGANSVRLRVWGINGERFKKDPFNDSAPTAWGSFAFSEAQLLDTGNVLSGPTDWTHKSFTADFGTGYDVILIEFLSGGVSASDFVAVDNVSITGAAPSGSGGTTLTDNFNNVDNMWDFSGNWTFKSDTPEAFDGDTSRLARYVDQNAYVAYHLDNLETFSLKLYYYNTLTDVSSKVHIQVSADGVNWTNLSTTYTDTATTNGWTRRDYSATSIPSGNNYIKISLDQWWSDGEWNGQLGSMTITGA